MREAMNAPLRRIPVILCSVAASAFLCASLLSTGRTIEAVVALLPGLLLPFDGRLRTAWLPTACLFCLVCGAGAALLLGVPAFLAIAGVTSALAAWDLANLEAGLGTTRSGRAVQPALPAQPAHGERRLRQAHARLLGLSLGVGLLVAGAALSVSLRIPFFVMVLLALLNLLCLGGVFRILSREAEKGQ